MSFKQTVEKLSIEGLNNCTVEQLHLVGTELGLSDIADKAARRILSDSAGQQLDQIRINAPLQTLEQATRRFVPNGKTNALARYLKGFTSLWAKRYAEDVLKGKNVPTVSLPKAPVAVLPAALDQVRVSDTVEAGGLFGFETLLESLQIPFQETREGEISFRLGCGDVAMQFFADVIPDAVVVFAYLPILVPIYRRSAMLEALNRINWRLSYPTFEMDPEDGQVRLRGLIPSRRGLLETEIASKCLASIRHEAALFSKTAY
jgi:hypothetical protein